MCGIAGFYSKNSNSENINLIIDQMNNLQSHRGPNSSGKFINDENTFGFKMCRLSILDLELGIQPMYSLDKRYVIIFNGTILNAPELRKELEVLNIKFITKNSDTEVLLNVLIKFGIDGIVKLNGSFAFAFYDKKENNLICGRDRFGLAPFYYLYKNGNFQFASELKSILYTGFSSKEIDKQNLFHYLSLLWSPGPDTIIKDIKKLQPGNYLEINFKKNSFKIQKWFQLKFEPDNKLKINDWKLLIQDNLKKSVIRSTLSDVPLSCGLSGGLDSQSITGILSNIDKKLNTFSLAFEGFNKGPLNELSEARIAADQFKTNHTEIIINQKNYLDELDKMVYHLDEPYAGALPLWHVFKEAGKDFGVILTGLGGDELFGNFGRWTLLEKTFYDVFDNYFQFKFLFFDRKYFFSDEFKNKLILKDTGNFQNTCEFLHNKISDNKIKNIRDKVCFLDMTATLPDEYCNMVNKFSMANQIEARAPFLDNNLTNLMLKVPSKIRTDKNDFKYLLRGSVENIIPKKNLANRKRGFVGLESQKISHNFDILINETFEKNKIMRQGIFQEKFLKKFLVSFKNSGKFTETINFGYKKTYNEKSLWAIIMFQKWYDIFIK